MTEKKPRPARRRARKPDGKFQGDDPSTPRNEAWEAAPIEEGLPKKKATTVAPKVKTTTTSTAGKYGKRAPITRPGANNITTTYH
mgnify:CR=1 FL=1|tara:strand:- start:699 stop:953 length:255 start_codon:yes stop_codon:yes gene_type:complete